jgi:dihydropteroate synthase type 2
MSSRPNPHPASRPSFQRPKILGILNITRDSFSDGGQFLEPGQAVEQGMQLWRSGADFVDIGAQATGPDAAMVSADLEIARIERVVTLLKRAGVAVSVDTFRPQVMLAAIRLGAEMINDVNGFRDPACIEVVAQSDARLIVMHSTSDSPQAQPRDIPADCIIDRILEFWHDRVETLTRAGVERERIILDPGLGYFLSTNPAASVAVYRQFDQLQTLGLPICLAASRKSFIGALLGGSPDNPDEPRDVSERQYGTLACELFAAARGVQYVRTHAVAALADVYRVWGAIT